MLDVFEVHKFGGTSVRDADRYRRVAALVSGGGGKKGVVVSAMAGVTDALIDLLSTARARDPAWRDRFAALLTRHREAIGELLEGEARADLEERLDKDAKDLEDILRATFILRSCSEPTLEYVSGHGELWSARLLAALLRSRGVDARFVDAREVLVVRPGEIAPVVEWEESRQRMTRALLKMPSDVLVITGYIASAPDGTPTTLKRNGSDYSASIFGSLLDARSITIWTDVDGVLSADPRAVPEAVVTAQLSYQEAMELAYFGAKVLHPSTMGPAVDKGIPIHIKNTFRPEATGTVISARPGDEGGEFDPAKVVRGFASVDSVALVNVEGNGMIGVPGVSQRVFGALREVGVSVIMISQASSEHSICFAVPEAQGERARDTVQRAFLAEIQQGLIEDIELISPVSILAAVGDRMAETPGVSGKLMSALGNARVNIRAIAQGSSERNISVVVDHKDATRALRAAHAAFYLSEQTLSVGVIGPGLVGGTLLAQLEAQREALKALRIDLRLRGIATSTKMVLDDVGIPIERWRERLGEGVPLDLAAFTEHMRAPHLPHAVVLDCTATDLGDWYERWLSSGVHLITPNKKAGSGPFERYQRLRALSRLGGKGRFFYEATVGAGLPVITTLRDLIQTGDGVLSIEGVFSGTLAYLFNSYDGARPFSEIVRDAKQRGYTEPDPRDDLSGTDVARKLIILAREMGLSLELDDVPVESLVPDELARIDGVDAFLEALPSCDEAMRQRVAKAKERGSVLRYVGVIDVGGKARVELREYPETHAFGRLSGSDNIIAFTTERYRDQPLIVQGPGAGPAVTAGGVFADLLRLAQHLGAPA